MKILCVDRALAGLPAVVACVAALTASAGQTRTPTPPLPSPPPQDLCGNPDMAMRRTATAGLSGLAPGTFLAFEQDPPLLSGDDDRPIVLRRLTVVGDYQRMWIVYPRPGTPYYDQDEFGRVETDAIDGVTVSRFEPSWSRAEWQQRLPSPTIGLDGGTEHGLYATVVPLKANATSLPVGGAAITVRYAPSTVPLFDLVRVDSNVQYTARVVNIVVPGFGSGRVSGGAFGWKLQEATRLFYRHFADVYQSIILVPGANAFASYGAFYQRTSNDVTGIGLPLHDDTGPYGSAGVLRGVGLFVGTVNHALLAHELGHQWGNYINWAAITGLKLTDTVHAPLWADRESSIASRLSPLLRIVARPGASSGWQVALAPTPLRYHPMLLYAMGRLSPEEVPPVVLFSNQQQPFLPLPGSVVTGPVRTATIGDVVRVHGPRTGPVPDGWRTAVVVVSEDHLMSARELSWWSFLAERLEDPERTGAMDASGLASFDAMTGIDVQTAVIPLERPGLPGQGRATLDGFGGRDLPGIVFDRPFPASFPAGEATSLTGAVDLDRFPGAETLRLVFQTDLGTYPPTARLTVTERLSDRGGFSAQVVPEPGASGMYRLMVTVTRAGRDEVVGYLQPIEIR